MALSQFTHALVRTISRSLGECELTHLPRQRIDVPLAARQHENYVNELRAQALEVRVLPEEPALPDATFVEDLAVMLDEVTVIGRPGCASRLAEVDRITPVLRELGPVASIQAPGTLEGGDVLPMGKTLFVGLSGRTNRDGVRQLESIVGPHGYRVVPVNVTGCLHLKTGATLVGPELILTNPHWVDAVPFTGVKVLTVPETEPWGGNTLLVNGVLLVTASAPRTADQLVACGLNVRRVNLSELQRAEAGLTCLSLLYRRSPQGEEGR